jgi:hypothetical protein
MDIEAVRELLRGPVGENVVVTVVRGRSKPTKHTLRRRLLAPQ